MQRRLFLCCVAFLGCNEAQPKSEASLQSTKLQPTSAPSVASTSTQGATLAPSSTTTARSKATSANDVVLEWFSALRDKDNEALLEMASFPFELIYSDPWRREPARTLCAQKTATDKDSLNEVIECIKKFGAPAFVEQVSTKLKSIVPSDLSIYDASENARAKLAASKESFFIAASFKGPDYRDSVVIEVQKTSDGFKIAGFFVHTSFVGKGPLPGIKF